MSASCSNGDLRLRGGSTSNTGRLEICINGAWGSVCDSGGDSFTTAEAVVACRQMGLLQVEGKLQALINAVISISSSLSAVTHTVLSKV